MYHEQIPFTRHQSTAECGKDGDTPDPTSEQLFNVWIRYERRSVILVSHRTAALKLTSIKNQHKRSDVVSSSRAVLVEHRKATHGCCRNLNCKLSTVLRDTRDTNMSYAFIIVVSVAITVKLIFLSLSLYFTMKNKEVEITPVSVSRLLQKLFRCCYLFGPCVCITKRVWQPILHQRTVIYCQYILKLITTNSNISRVISQ